MNAASHIPSGVFTVTSVSVSGRAAAASAAGVPVTAANPAAKDKAPNSRRDTADSFVVSLGLTSLFISTSVWSSMARSHLRFPGQRRAAFKNATVPPDCRQAPAGEEPWGRNLFG